LNDLAQKIPPLQTNVFVRNLPFFLKLVYPRQAFRLSLLFAGKAGKACQRQTLLKFINMDVKSFITFGPEVILFHGKPLSNFLKSLATLVVVKVKRILKTYKDKKNLNNRS
jgi:hypothetical protein